MITHLELDILECEDKWALGSITTNKASGSDGIPVELFQILKRCCCESAALNLPANLENSAAATGLEKVNFHSNLKECSNYHTSALISHASKVILKILQARLQEYVNCELPFGEAGFKNGSRTNVQIANICWIIEKAKELQKNIYFCFIDYDKAFDCVDHNKLWKILKEMGLPDHLTCLLRNVYAGSSRNS